MPNKKLTVAQYVIARLSDLGIKHIFGVPGDYTFPFDGAIEDNKDLDFTLCANELNAAYAADGYARIHGVAALTTTYAVGELSALNGVMGSKSQRLPIFHLVGAPSSKIQRQHLVTHHTLGDGVFNNFRYLSEAACCASAVLDQHNTVYEMERLIDCALYHRMPVYITVAMDIANLEVLGDYKVGHKVDLNIHAKSDKNKLNQAISLIEKTLNKANTVTAIPTSLAKQYGLTKSIEKILKKANIPYVSTPSDKAILSEESDGFIGLYDGVTSNPLSVKQIVESSDVVLEFGEFILQDLTTGGWTDDLDKNKRLIIGDHYVRLGSEIIDGVFINDVVHALEYLAIKPLTKINFGYPEYNKKVDGDKLSSFAVYNKLQNFLKEGDDFISETGNSMTETVKMKFPKGANFHSQSLWGSIGWATPATLGVALAKTHGRTILFTGDGSHQLTANEIGAMGRSGIKPIIFVVNNGIYGVEEVVNNVYRHYNDLAKWDYHKLPEAMGCNDWYVDKVSTVSRLEKVLETLKTWNHGAYIELVIPKEECKHLPDEVLNKIYKAN